MIVIDNLMAPPCHRPRRIREIFRRSREILQRFRRFFKVFEPGRTHSDTFGPIGMHSDAFGSNWKRLDVFEKFDIVWVFESFFNVSGRNFYKRLFSRLNITLSTMKIVINTTKEEL